MSRSHTISNYTDILRSHCRPLAPIETGQEPRLVNLGAVRAVLFDVYGTLFVSDSGEIGAATAAEGKIAVSNALNAVGLNVDATSERTMAYFFETIEKFHAASRKNGADYPEVEIDKVWHEVLTRLDADDGGGVKSFGHVDLKRLAVEYEARSNPVWPMPGIARCVRALRSEGVLLGIVSNAQFYTPLLFEALLGKDTNELGFEGDLQFFSYRYGHAKPGPFLFEEAVKSLKKKGIGPSETVYVGNDMLNDIYAAQSQGLKTALFAGDQRSLRLREGDPRVENVVPDLILTALGQISQQIAAR